MHVIASPLPTLKTERTTEKTLDRLLDILSQHDIDEIVIGLPYRLSGQIGLQADEVRHFAEALGHRINIPITFWDERLTSLQADRAMREGGLSRKKRAKHVDALAAVLILQSYLDSLIP